MVRVYTEREGNRYLLSVKDHATGSAEVCAAVSALVCAFAGFAKTAEANGKAEVYNLKLDSGNALIHCRGDHDVGTAMETVVLGLMQVSISNPEYVFVEEGE